MSPLLLSYVLAISGTVPVVCWTSADEYFCNTAFTLYQDGNVIKFPGPAHGRAGGSIHVVPKALLP